MALTIQQKFVMVLEGCGLTIVGRGKFIVMCRKESVMGPGKKRFHYVGKRGSLRAGVSQAASIPASENFKRLLLKRYERLNS